VSIEAFATRIPPHLSERSGKVFYSGRDAFRTSGTIYMLGVNPGGAPTNHVQETVSAHTAAVLNDLPDDWSAYRDESWEGAPPGTYGMAPRVLHLLRQLGLKPGSVPASNLVFVRSAREAHIDRKHMAAMADACWPFHEDVIGRLRPRVVLCFGQTAGSYVRRRLGANRLVGHFVEQNARRWRSCAYSGAGDVNVVVASHPSIANWCSPATDISPLVRDAMR
jgi:hypothetical protein